MATSTFVHLYDDYADAERALRELVDAGIDRGAISLVAKNPEQRKVSLNTGDNLPGEAAGTGASLGAILGAGAGLLAGFGALAIPGIGPVVAAGWLVATLTGAAAGAAAVGLIGLLIGTGLSEEEANIYAEGVRRGGTLVTVKIDDNRGAEVDEIMRRNRCVDLQERAKTYREDGWTGFKETIT